MTLQLIIHRLNEYWMKEGCLIGQPYPGEVGAGTYNPLTFLKVLGPKPWNVGYVELSKRPKDGRYAENPFRMQAFHQYQVILKPSPSTVQDIYLKSLSAFGINLKEQDIRFVEDDWESETLGARGLGWEVWLNGMEITQFTYFQEMGGIELNPVSVEITYGLGRIAMFIQQKESIFDLEWSEGVKYGDIYKREEYEFCKFNFEEANVELSLELFAKFEEESKRLMGKGLLYPAYDYALKSSHLLNLLDARNAISPDERKNYIARVRRLANAVAKLYVETEGK